MVLCNCVDTLLNRPSLFRLSDASKHADADADVRWIITLCKICLQQSPSSFLDATPRLHYVAYNIMIMTDEFYDVGAPSPKQDSANDKDMYLQQKSLWESTSIKDLCSSIFLIILGLGRDFAAVSKAMQFYAHP